ncbi:M48 family metallopeptidase [Xylophilus sp. Leaf220]|uniref:M48 family metallopeptidase n=1 Tax=Xylophilus sp. Leaf220 TaxID=1735686 RepID=UPI0006FCB6EF|nr:M48 family metallopeptidase [Xylophilus sp. Leaf220]KQM76650.1 peptidase M48 [Xylophilus sp. Leaf220]
MCRLCDLKTPAPAASAGAGGLPPRTWTRRGFTALVAAGGTSAALAQVDVGQGSRLRGLVPAETLEQAAAQQYPELMAQARAQNALAPDSHPQVVRLRAISQRIIPYTAQWNDRSRNWKWEVNLIGSKQINAFCMPGGKIAFYTGILDQLKLTDDETAMIMGHEMAHALREHARARVAKTQATQLGVSAISQLLGLGQIGQTVTGLGGELLTLRFSRADETDADIVGLELAARAGFDPQSAVSLWEKMGKASGAAGGPNFLSTHPSGPDRIRELQANVPKVEPLYEQAKRRG